MRDDVNMRLKDANKTRLAFEQMQDAFAGEAKRLGLTSEQDVVNLVKQVRMERRLTTQERLKIAESLFGSIPATMTLEEARDMDSKY